MRKRYPELSVHPFAAAGLFLLLFAAPKAYAFAVLSSVFLHELGHAVAARLLGKRIHGVRLMPTGINIEICHLTDGPESVFIAAAGPLMNTLYVCAAPLLPSVLVIPVKTVSFTLAAVNLLPLSPLDGGKIFSAVTSFLFGYYIAERIQIFLNALLLAVLWCLSLYIFFYSGVNFSLLLFCAYLFSYLILKKA